MDMLTMKKPEKEGGRQTTFSSRKLGLFKKATELCILSNAQAAITVSSPAGKLFSFGHPNADTIIDNYVNGTMEFEVKNSSEKSYSFEEYNRQYEEALKKLELEKKKLEELKIFEDVLKSDDWWNDPIDDMSSEELEQFIVCLDELRIKFVKKTEELAKMPPMV
ncbi:unnamed protein product [Lathyrus sativus]|nr:unnamed protein product [Lathyrus sativus]